MGLFSAVKDTYKKSEAAVVVQNLIEENVRDGIMESKNPAQLANILVGRVWDSMPDVFSGKFGQRPHKITIAAAALSYGIQTLGIEHRSAPELAFALGRILSQVEVNGDFFGFNSTDENLLTAATSVFMQFAEPPESSLAQFLNSELE